MDAKDILAVLKAKGVRTLHHANTTITVCSYLRAGALLSRAAVEKAGLRQTFQSSDALDKKFGLWNDLFLDGVDVHQRSRTRSHYGPISLELDLESVLSDPSVATSVYITKKNPVHWSDKEQPSDWFYGSVVELQGEYRFGDFGKHIILRVPSGTLKLLPHLRRIVIDDPLMQLDGTSIYDRAIADLAKAAEQSGIKVPFAKHDCWNGCACVKQYSAYTRPQQVFLDL